ncbi:putative phosphoglycerate mutase pmu1 [Hypoxylon texense]
MFARLRTSQIPTPVRSDPPQHPKAFKHRLFVGDDEEDNNSKRPLTPKRPKHTHYSAAPIFDRYKKPRVEEEEDDSLRRFYNRRRHLSPSPDPDPPLVTKLNDRYATLRATLHSAALAGLEEAEQELSAGATASIRGHRQQLAALDAQVAKLAAPLRDLAVDYTAVDRSGRERTAAVAIRDAAAAFERKVEAAAGELDGLWASWAEAQAEIEALAREMLSSSSSSRNGSSEVRLDGGDKATRGIAPETSASHDDALVGFGAALDEGSKEVVDEMRTYEEEFLKKIQQEAGNIMNSFLNR